MGKVTLFLIGLPYQGQIKEVKFAISDSSVIMINVYGNGMTADWIEIFLLKLS